MAVRSACQSSVDWYTPSYTGKNLRIGLPGHMLVAGACLRIPATGQTRPPTEDCIHCANLGNRQSIPVALRAGGHDDEMPNRSCHSKCVHATVTRVGVHAYTW